MLQTPATVRLGGVDLATRRQIALDRIQQLIALADERASRAMHNYYILQGLTIGLAAITPCLIFLAKDNPNAEILNWLQIFFPAVAAISAGLSHLFRWREDGVLATTLGETIRSILWRYETRAGEFGVDLSEDQALDRLVVRVDEVNLQSVARWSAAQVAESPAKGETPRPAPAVTNR